jgi:hypothetical protein
MRKETVAHQCASSRMDLHDLEVVKLGRVRACEIIHERRLWSNCLITCGRNGCSAQPKSARTGPYAAPSMAHLAAVHARWLTRMKKTMFHTIISAKLIKYATRVVSSFGLALLTSAALIAKTIRYA